MNLSSSLGAALYQKSTSILAFLVPLFVYLAILALYKVVPGKEVAGYVRDSQTGQPLRYKLNGLRVFFLVMASYVGLGWAGLLPWELFYVYRYESAIGACLLGLFFTLWIVLPAPKQRGLLADLYFGRLENPQRGGIDAKMFLYLSGATMLALNVVSCAMYHYQTYPQDPSPGVMLYTALFLFFIVDYLYFEEVHLYTYDFMAERVGFKLGWGCLVFYPFFYSIGAWSVAALPNPGVTRYVLFLSTLFFLSGWVLSRGANLQKFYFKRDPTMRAFGVLPPRALVHNGKYILIGGFWGLSRHINYLGEVLMALGLAISVGYPGLLGPWLYPLYYVALLVPRQLDDDKRCAQKYGPLWEEYKRAVPYRIIPWVY
jgi:protein-S-isoprenylcysteine O-methyltransferase Ste14